MFAIQYDHTGPPDVLHGAEVDRPVPIPTEVLVRVVAAGVNPVDWKTRAGKGMHAVQGPGPWIPGWDISGVVEAVGYGVTTLAPGDEVFGMPRFPRPASAYAEYVTAPSRQLARKPASLTHVEAAGLPLAGLIAWQALVDTAKVGAGERVLIHGAAGGVGHLAVQIARSRDAEVYGTATGDGIEIVRSLDAEPIDYKAAPFEESVGDLDLVIDFVGGDYASRSLRVLRRGGLLIEIPSASGLPPADVLDAAGVEATGIMVEPDGASLRRLAALADAGALQVHIGNTAPLDDAAEVHARAEAGGNRGKNVLVV